MPNTMTGKKKHQFKCKKCGFTLLTSSNQNLIIRCPKCGFHPNDEAEKEIYMDYVMNG